LVARLGHAIADASLVQTPTFTDQLGTSAVVKLGKLDCELFDDKVPLTVANFIGLACGNRPWKDDSGNWVQKPVELIRSPGQEVGRHAVAQAPAHDAAGEQVDDDGQVHPALPRYSERLEHGVQSPLQTLESGSGSCRDSAWLLVQALRCAGIAARFVSGYLLELARPDVAITEDTLALHPWADLYLPDIGWIGIDATSGRPPSRANGVALNSTGVATLVGRQGQRSGVSQRSAIGDWQELTLPRGIRGEELGDFEPRQVLQG
jgi:hypothetical protein